MTKQTITLPAIGPVAATFSQSFGGTSPSLVLSRPVNLKKSVDYNKKMSLLKKGVIRYEAKVWLGFFCYFLFIYKRTSPLLLHMKTNQMTLMSLMYRNVIDFNFLLSLTPSSVANIL